MTWASVSSTKRLKTGTIKFSLINGERRSGGHTSSMGGDWYKIATVCMFQGCFHAVTKYACLS